MKTPDQIFDELLVRQFISGDKKALELLIVRWKEPVKRQVIRCTRDSFPVADITQEVWMAVIKRIGTLREQHLFGIWVLRIANNKATDWVRAQIKERRAVNDYEMPTIDPSDHRLDLLTQAMKELPDEQRMVLAMLYLERMSVEEISSVLEIPGGTVKSRLFTARNKLKELITYNDGNETRY